MSNSHPFSDLLISLQEVKIFIKNSLIEDVGKGDVTTNACIAPHQKGNAIIYSKGSGIAAGVELAKFIFEFMDTSVKVEIVSKDGSRLNKGDTILKIRGKVRPVLTSERMVLNCMQRMCGIATITNEVVNLVKNFPVKIIDSRKTAPQLRFLDKWAVRIGGAHNHRMGLYDAVMIKDNHIDFSGGIEAAINNTNQYLKKIKKKLNIIIEARTLEHVHQIVGTGGVDRILLDNFTPAKLKEAVKIIDKKFFTEASGGITKNNVVAYAKTGVDYISMGSLTHSIKWLDLSLCVSV